MSVLKQKIETTIETHKSGTGLATAKTDVGKLESAFVNMGTVAKGAMIGLAVAGVGAVIAGLKNA